MKAKLARIMGETMSKEQRAQELQELLKEEERRNKYLDRDLKVLKEQQFKRAQDIFKLRQEEKNIFAEISGGEVTTKNMGGKIHR